jgi:phage baseplate assembly protein W
MARDIRGIAVNFRFGDRGYPEPADNDDLLSNALYTILSTKTGERVHRPTFGCELKRILFANVTRGSTVRARVEARRAIEQWEQRVVVDDILVSSEDSRIVLDISWRPRNNLADARRSRVPIDSAEVR